MGSAGDPYHVPMAQPIHEPSSIDQFFSLEPTLANIRQIVPVTTKSPTPNPTIGLISKPSTSPSHYITKVPSTIFISDSNDIVTHNVDILETSFNDYDDLFDDIGSQKEGSMFSSNSTDVVHSQHDLKEASIDNFLGGSLEIGSSTPISSPVDDTIKIFTHKISIMSLGAICSSFLLIVIVTCLRRRHHMISKTTKAYMSSALSASSPPKYDNNNESDNDMLHIEPSYSLSKSKQQNFTSLQVPHRNISKVVYQPQIHSIENALHREYPQHIFDSDGDDSTISTITMGFFGRSVHSLVSMKDRFKTSPITKKLSFKQLDFAKTQQGLLQVESCFKGNTCKHQDSIFTNTEEGNPSKIVSSKIFGGRIPHTRQNLDQSKVVLLSVGDSTKGKMQNDIPFGYKPSLAKLPITLTARSGHNVSSDQNTTSAVPVVVLMPSPTQPLTRGKNEGKEVIAYEHRPRVLVNAATCLPRTATESCKKHETKDSETKSNKLEISSKWDDVSNLRGGGACYQQEHHLLSDQLKNDQNHDNVNKAAFSKLWEDLASVDSSTSADASQEYNTDDNDSESDEKKRNRYSRLASF
eukprot:CAMPEP_0194357866 /NCGR_PEP_ID=MMETSP0174-20130528/5285_1 /TAXON_ID=216777 /ORGANISM="Proboscia alata, Strain PI-D3" /LENGTH=580 /DNA_ID=CAMNT_0039128057 /DNA_START=462 /DNA_END=2204 /DNA_ORIENTATION=-